MDQFLNRFAWRRRQQPPLKVIWRETAAADVYDQARTSRVFNSLIPERYPTAIVFASTEQHVVQAMEIATERKIRVSVRAGGHSYASWSLRDNALLLDLGEYHESTLDEKTGIVRVSPSTTGVQLDKYLLAKSRAFPGGHCPDVAVGGFLLGGGMGWNTNVSSPCFCIFLFSLALWMVLLTFLATELGLGL